MTNAKRTTLTVLAAATTIVICAFLALLWMPSGVSVFAALHDFLVPRVLCTLVGVIALACALYGLVKVIGLYVHARAQLSAGEGGSISIERNALVSVAQRSLDAVPGFETQAVGVDVVQRKGTAVLDVKVTAAPSSDASLMSLASAIQTAVKSRLEQFTEHEVRYVAVNFVEQCRGRGDEGEDEASASEEDATVASPADASATAPGPEVPEGADASGGPAADAGATPEAATGPHVRTRAQGDEGGRVGAWFARRRSSKPREVIVDAVAEDVTDAVRADGGEAAHEASDVGPNAQTCAQERTQQPPEADAAVGEQEDDAGETTVEPGERQE